MEWNVQSQSQLLMMREWPKHAKPSRWIVHLKTSRERPKSAPYLRLKKTRKRKPLFLQMETTKALKKLKIEKKIRFFFRNVFEVSGKSHSAEKCKRGDALGFFEHPFCCKISKIYGRNNKKNSEISLTVPKKGGKSHSVENGGPFCFGMAFYLMLEALDALKMKYQVH